MPPRSLLLAHGDRERLIRLNPGEEIVVGRALDAGFFLNEPSISRKHCKLRATTTSFEVEDLGSRNACFLNGRRVVTRTLLTDGSVLQIGRLPFTVKFLEAVENVPCSGCGQLMDPGLLTGTPDGSGALCAECVVSQQWGGDSQQGGQQLEEVIEGCGFQILQPLGGLPKSFKVQRGALGKALQIKAIELPPEVQDRVAKMRDDVKALAQLEHEALTAIYDVIEAPNVLLLVHALESGETAEQVLKRTGPLGPRTAVDIVKTLARAVVLTAANNVLHKEITPANVRIDKFLPENVAKGDRIQVRLTNFALVRDLVEFSHSFSAAGELDRLLYVAPETVVEPGRVDVRADVFGLGAVLLYLLTGRSPWGKDVKPQTHVQKLINSGVTAVPLALDGVPPALKPILEKLLAPDRNQRAATAEAALALLNDAAKAVSGEGAPASGGAAGVIVGDFATDELIEFVQLVEINKKSGHLEVWSGEISGKLVITNGRLGGANAPGVSGLDAAKKLLVARSGRFRFTPATKPEPGASLQANLSALLLDVMRVRDEENRTV